MRANYDFSKMKRIKNPYPALLKRPITIRLDVFTIAYFKRLADEVGMSYQGLINLYLRDCVNNHKMPSVKWKRRRLSKSSDTPAVRILG